MLARNRVSFWALPRIGIALVILVTLAYPRPAPALGETVGCLDGLVWYWVETLQEIKASPASSTTSDDNDPVRCVEMAQDEVNDVALPWVPTGVAVVYQLPAVATPGCTVHELPWGNGSMAAESCYEADNSDGGWWGWMGRFYVESRSGDTLWSFGLYLEWKGDGANVTEMRANHCSNLGTDNGYEYDDCTSFNTTTPAPTIHIDDNWEYHYICCYPNQPRKTPRLEADINGRGGISGTVYFG